jgi:hypothetical protein
MVTKNYFIHGELVNAMTTTLKNKENITQNENWKAVSTIIVT